MLGVLIGIVAMFLSRWGPPLAWLRRFLGLSVFRSHRLATLRDVLVVLTLRASYFGVFVGFVVFVVFVTMAVRPFGAAVPLSHVIATVPPILGIGTRPITPAGLDTQQSAVVYFYGGFAPEAELLALA